MSRRSEERDLSELLRLCGVRRSHLSDLTGRRERAPVESLRAVLVALGHPAETPKQLAHSLEDLQHERAARVLEPVHVAWQGRSPSALLRVASARRPARAGCRLDLEDGSQRSWTLALSGARATRAVRGRAARDGRVRAIPLALPDPLPHGIHRLSVEVGGARHEAVVISAPRRAYRPPAERRWGGFLPLYALLGERSWGAGHFGDLAQLGERLAEIGGDVLATLPLLPASSTGRCSPARTCQ